MSNEELDIKKAKLTEPDPAIQNCGHWVKRKKRYCKMTVAKGKAYCGEHSPAIPSNATDETTGDERIPCPLDNSHTVYKRNVHKHLKICNARKTGDEPAYIQKGINAGDVQHSTEDYSKIKLTELDDEEFYTVINKVKGLHLKFVQDEIETLDLQHKSLDAELTNSDYGKEAKKHLQQTAALLGILENEHCIQDGTSFIEFGAGKGQLAFFLAQLLQQCNNSQVVLLDRMSLRHKKDNKIEDKSLIHRIRVDIADFLMAQLELLRQTKRCIAVSKHLCGAATDLTLRCITQNCALPTTHVVIALCCHHRCEWRSFVGKKFFETQNITPRQFAIITKMVGWAICGTGMSRERRRAMEEQSLTPQEINELHSAQRLSLAERERIGFMCKRVLDFARLEFLREQGYEVALKNYVPREVTLENVCLIAKKLKQPI